MTSRPGPGLHESLQSRGSILPPRAQVRRPLSKPAIALVQPDCIDPTLEDEHPPLHAGAHDALRVPPRGRPQYLYSTLTGNGLELPIHSLPYQPTANLPVPPRPGSLQSRDTLQLPRIVPGGSGVKDDPKTSVPEAIAPPVSLPGGKVADVFPWTGNNAEDILSEALVKGGISNKPQIMNETNTARPSLWSNLKNKSGLSTLSTLFVAVLEKRQQGGRLHAPNNFKPPPRLTLRDSTREQWLHDLANPSTGLRRLSRTIPHGLTGKVLLEQCLNKNIPLPRALWLAKCVGINELRAHKRKGQAGTVTWSRGWTSCVEQFLDGVIATIGQGNWKPRITYALQLTTYLYKEHLLDNDHFLDWVLHGLEVCPSERLFIWLLIASVPQYWTDITSCRQRGKRLAMSLLGQLEKIYRFENLKPYIAVLQYLENTLVKLMATRPACLLLPTAWDRYGIVLYKLAGRRDHSQIYQAVERLDQRNNRLMPSLKKVNQSSQSLAERIYCSLDSVDYTRAVRIEDLALACMDMTTDSFRLVGLVLGWACSSYRFGEHRMYLATRLLRRWSHLGVDVYETVLTYLRGLSWAESGDAGILFRIIGELVRSKTFPIGRYLQWLIATGSLAHRTDLSLPEAWPIRLITEIPLTGLSDQIRTLRYTLLRGTDHSAENEGHALNEAEQGIAQSLPALFGSHKAGSESPRFGTEHLSPTVKLELGIWLRRHVANYAEVNERVPTKDPAVEETAAVTLIESTDFALVRSYLESFGDLAILADVVGIVASSLDPSVLAAAADTINYHSMVFRAMGACDPLYSRIATRYAAIRNVRFPDRELLFSLANLTRTIQADGQLPQLLNYDLSRLDQKNLNAACSPASDNMGEVLHSALCSGDEIERILSSGTSMDQQMMARVLRKILSKLQEHALKTTIDFDSYPSWLYRLRSFDEAAFEVVANEWVSSTMAAHQVTLLKTALPILVGTGSVSLTSVSEALRAFVVNAKAQPSHESFSCAVAYLQHLLVDETLVFPSPVHEAYRYRLEQRKLSRNSVERIVDCLADVLSLGSALPMDVTDLQLSDLLSCAPVQCIMKRCLTERQRSLPRSIRDTAGPHFRLLLHTLLDPSDRFHMSQKSPDQQVLAVFDMASELSLPVCQAVIEQIFAAATAASEESRDRLSAAALSATKTAVERSQSAGLLLLASLDDCLTDQVRRHAEHEIISAASFLLTPHAVKNSTDTPLSTVHKYLAVLDLTRYVKSVSSDDSTLHSDLIERLRGIVHVLNSHTESDMHPSESANQSLLQIYAWSTVLLRLVTSRCYEMLLHISNQHQLGLVAAMKSLILHPVLEMYPSITEHIFDMAVYISDYISDDVRNNLSRMDANGLVDDARCLFVSGVTAPVDGWLVLMKPFNAAVSHSSSQPPTPTTSQGQQSPLQSPQLMTGETSTPQQRLFAQQQAQRQQHQLHYQQAQQTRSYNQVVGQPNKTLPAQLQWTQSLTGTPSPLQQMQQMQQLQGLAQQRAMQPSPVNTQRQAPGVSHGQSVTAGPGKMHAKQEKEIRHYPFTQSRWEILAESSGNPTSNETAISMSLFGARRV